MTLATLTDVLTPALREGYAVAGVVCLGWEDSRAYAAAAEAEGLPIILQAGPGARAHMPIPVWARMLRHLAEAATVPVVVHLDHGTSLEDCRVAIGEGFSSIMYDGSLDPLDRNIADMTRIVEMAHAAGVSCEGEVGVVGYDGGAASHGTDPQDARRFAIETCVDALAVSVGNVHLQTGPGAGLDRARIAAIEAATGPLPLVIHGGTGVPQADRTALARETAICKFNIGTELRQTFGAALRQTLAAYPTAFDRIEILRATEAPLEAAARKVLRGLRP